MPSPTIREVLANCDLESKNEHIPTFRVDWDLRGGGSVRGDKGGCRTLEDVIELVIDMLVHEIQLSNRSSSFFYFYPNSLSFVF